jgi:hypothetical protein
VIFHLVEAEFMVALMFYYFSHGVPRLLKLDERCGQWNSPVNTAFPSFIATETSDSASQHANHSKPVIREIS